MPSAEDRIVKMEFDNAAFEKKIASTIESLGQLDKALKFSGATKGLNDVNDAIKNVKVDHLGNSIEDVSKKFIALSTIAITTLVNITNQALHTGMMISKAFTIQPILDGFHEYETQLNSVQTILANTATKGTTLDQVNAALQQLNTYSDQTIYNFGQMAKNIGTFTAAGVDLDTSVQSIKGIANLAAMSGSSADQAATAMYQLSQAIATGSLKLIDWNSVVNAGMGGEAFKTALFETGKAMGTLLDVPLTQTFKEWEDSGHNFRESLQDGWITADVLTTTLSGFTGDLTEEMLIAKGFSQDVASQIVKTAAIAKAAATEVKTFTQLVGTVKEAVGSGWTESFQLIIGNFTQAKELWTGVNNSIGAFVQKNADARNAILAGWQAFGGRTTLIDAVKTSFEAFGQVLAPIKEAFQNVFPPLTVQKLLEITDAFHRFAESLKPSQSTIDTLRIVFKGLFSALSIGWTIISEGTKFIVGLAKSLLGLVSPEVSSFMVNLGLGISNLQAALVRSGGIKDFFDMLTKALQKPIEYMKKFKEAVEHLFDGFSKSAVDSVEGGVDRLTSRFEGLKNFFGRLGDIWQPFEDALMKVAEVLGRVWDYISGWFKELGKRLGDVMGPGDFDAFLDILNTAFFGGIVLLFKRFVDKGLKLDIGEGLIARITGTFGELTNTLKAMQLNIKANAILKIAGAIAILTGSVLVLSMINSEDLAKALSAMAVGFTELMASFSVFTKIASTPMSALSFSVLSVGLGILSTALLILSGVVKVFADMSWEDMARGLAGVSGLLGVLVLAAKPLAASSKGMIAAGIGITAMAVGLVILSGAVKVFATMSWEKMGKGLAGVAAALLIIAGAMKLMPDTLPITAAGLILVGIGLLIVAGAVAIFGHMKWEVIGKGLVGVAGALLIIAGAMQMMPATLPITAAGLILVGIALGEIALAMKMFGKMKWDEIGRGLTVLAGTLAILAVSLILMTGSVAGSLALIVAANALLVLAGVLKILGSLSWGDLLQSLGKLAVVLAAFALIALVLQPAVGAMLALGAALFVLGAAFALAGVGAYLIAKALEAFVKVGSAGLEMIGALIDLVAKKLPGLMKAAAKGFVAMVMVFAKAAPVFAHMIGKLIDSLLDEIIPLLPKLALAIGVLISEILKLIRDKAPEYIATGFFVLTKLLEGLRDNIGPITELVAQIIVNFIDELSKQLEGIIDAVINLWINFMLDVAHGLGKVAGTLLFGIGEAFVEGFIEGLEDTADDGLMKWVLELPGKILGWIGGLIKTLWDKGVELITGFIEGIVNKAEDVIKFFTELPKKILGWVGDTFWTLVQKGWDLIDGLATGAFNKFLEFVGWLKGIGEALLHVIDKPHQILVDIGEKILDGLWNGMKDVWEHVKHWIEDIAGSIADFFTSALDIFSPSRVMKEIGEYTIEGLHIGMKNEWENVDTWLGKLDPASNLNSSMADNMAKTVNGALQRVMDNLGDTVDMSPVITPILDLTQLQAGASQIAGLIPASTTYGHAQIIAKQPMTELDTSSIPSSGGNVKFEQTINSPTQLSTSEIYKQTRNQITIAKEELSIL